MKVTPVLFAMIVLGLVALSLNGHDWALLGIAVLVSVVFVGYMLYEFRKSRA